MHYDDIGLVVFVRFLNYHNQLRNTITQTHESNNNNLSSFIRHTHTHTREIIYFITMHVYVETILTFWCCDTR